MKFNEFIGQVQQRARLPSEADALAATRATLKTLSERLMPATVEHLAAQLPQEIGEFFQPVAGEPQRFSLNDFFDRACEREGVDKSEAVIHSRAVMDVFQDAVPPDEINKLRAQLPREFDSMFESGNQGSSRS